MRTWILLACLAVAYAATPIHYVNPVIDNSAPAAGFVAASACGCGACPCPNNAPLATNVVIDDAPHAIPRWNDPNVNKPKKMATFKPKVAVQFCNIPANFFKKRCKKLKKKPGKKTGKKTKQANKQAKKVEKSIAKLKGKVAKAAATGSKKTAAKALAKVEQNKARIADAQSKLDAKSKKGPNAAAVQQKLNQEKQDLKKVQNKLQQQLNGAKPAAPKAAGLKPKVPGNKQRKEKLTSKAVSIAYLVKQAEDAVVQEAKDVDNKLPGVTAKVSRTLALIAQATRALKAQFLKLKADLAAKKITQKTYQQEVEAATLLKNRLKKIVAAVQIVKTDNKKNKAKKF